MDARDEPPVNADRDQADADGRAALPARDGLAALRAVLAQIEQRLGKGKVRRGSELIRGTDPRDG